MKSLALSSLVCLTLISCGGKDEINDIISMEEFAGEVGMPETDSAVSEIDSILNSALSPIDIAAVNLLAHYDTLELVESFPFDRFDYSKSKKVKFKGKHEVHYGKTNMVFPTADVFYYNFSDSTKTKNAFYNWLDCFGSDCYPLALKEDVDHIKMPPLTSWIYDTTIVVVQYKCEHAENDWKSFEDSLVKCLGKDYKYTISVKCGGPLKWN